MAFRPMDLARGRPFTRCAEHDLWGPIRRGEAGGRVAGPTAVRASAALALLSLSLGCTPTGAAPRTLRLEHIQPESNDGVYLNEDLLFMFSRPVDLSTVTREAIQIQAADGRPARGRWRVEGRTVRFQPDPVLAPDLGDGGYRADTAYQVRIVGFPRLDGIRGLDGSPLESSFVWGFRTVAVSDRQGGFVFDDVSPGTADMLRMTDSPARSSEGAAAGSVRIGSRDSFFLVCKEPLDPSTLFDEDFALHGPDGLVDVHTRFRANHDVGESPLGEVGAVVEVIPHHPLSRGVWQLRLHPDLRLRDFGGNPVWRPFGPTLGQQLEVDEGGRVEGHGELFFSFVNDDRFSPIAVPGADGTAHWRDAGRLTVRFPAAAGSGRDGRVDLGPHEARADVQATQLSLAQSCRLAPGRGLRVLRAQGRIEIEGDLLREETYRDEAPPPELAEDLSAANLTLSDWLARVEREDGDWTVVIAGGDLFVSGSVRVDTPLLLVAGGRLRIQGEVRARGPEVWLLGGGGGLGLKSQASIASLALDAPVANPLQVALRYAAVSSPVPNVGHVARWLSTQAGGQAGAGAWRVRYLPAQNPLLFDSAVDDPRLLDGKGPIRMLVELDVGPGERWDPPFVDYVRLSWEEDVTGEGN